MSNNKVNLQLSQAEYRAFKSLNTIAGKKLLKQFEQEVQRDKVQLAEYRSQLKEIQGIANGTKWLKDKNVETIRKIDGQYNIVKTDGQGKVSSITPLQNGMDISHKLRNELKALDNIDYQMFQDGHLQNTKAITRETYEVREMLTGKPLDYTTEYALREPIDGQMPRVNARMQAIENEYSTEGRRVAKEMEHDLTMKIDKLAVETGEKRNYEYNHNSEGLA